MEKLNKSFRYALLADDITAKRKAEGITLKQMSAATNLPLATCHRAENKKGGLDIATIISLCNWLNEHIQKYLTYANNAKNTDRKKQVRKSGRKNTVQK